MNLKRYSLHNISHYATKGKMVHTKEIKEDSEGEYIKIKDCHDMIHEIESLKHQLDEAKQQLSKYFIIRNKDENNNRVYGCVKDLVIKAINHGVTCRELSDATGISRSCLYRTATKMQLKFKSSTL